MKRLTIMETAGRERAFSYLVETDCPAGTFDDENIPEDIFGEIESFVQGNDVPPFLYEPKGSILYRLEEVSR